MRVNIYRMLEDGFLHLEDVGESDATRLIEITRKYPQADLADATLVVLAGRLGSTDIATLDKTDFWFTAPRRVNPSTTCSDDEPATTAA